ncbi:MAG: CBS domain-containing protein [Saprospiraceae bacterium]
MRRDYLVLDVDMPIQEVYEKLMSSCSVAPVLDHGELIGIVDKENINR